MNYIDKKIKEFDEKFEWTDFAGGIGCFVLAKKSDSYAIEKTERQELKSFFRSSLEGMVKECEKCFIKTIDKDFLIGKNQSATRWCIECAIKIEDEIRKNFNKLKNK